MPAPANLPNKGRLSFTTDATGNRLVDMTELERVFEPLRNPDEEEPAAPASDGGRMPAAIPIVDPAPSAG